MHILQSDKVLCASVCGARCCKLGIVALTEEEAERLPRLAQELRLNPPPIRLGRTAGGAPAQAMLIEPCVFLGKNNLCQIYKDRPGRCRAFPESWREGCLLSQRWYGDDTDANRLRLRRTETPQERGHLRRP